MNVITTNNPDQPTLGICTDIEGLKDVGDFDISLLEDWLRQIRMVFGDGADGKIRVQFKMSDDPKQPGYAITASVDGNEPHVVVCGRYRMDGGVWGGKP